VNQPLPERFADLGLIEPIARAVAEEGYERPTPIQARCVPHVLAGRDLLGLAQTGTGKTAAFALPILQNLWNRKPDPSARGPRPIRCLVLTPTRELASQIAESFTTYGRHLRLRVAVIFGGVGMEPQKQLLRSGVDVLIATPGRLLDLAGQGFLDVARLEVFVLDEADRMLDMGFIHDVKRVIRLLPPKRQTLFFSATMPPEAQQLADALLRDPVQVTVAVVSSTADRIQQEVAFVRKADKRAMLVHVLRDAAMRRVLVFARTKHGANRIAEHLEGNRIGAAAIHGNKSQGARERALEQFKSGANRVLVATDIAARGIDIDDITHVVNFDLPEVPETYVHRIGRTARAGASGFALSFCDEEEGDLLRAIERLIRREIPVVDGHPYALAGGRPAVGSSPSPQTLMQRRRDERRRNERGGQPRSQGGGHGHAGQGGQARSGGSGGGGWGGGGRGGGGGGGGGQRGRGTGSGGGRH
jgi:ATP-dependent RNA helicase RhlE